MGKKLMLSSTQLMPGAVGRVNADEDKNENVRVDLKVENLANPSLLMPPANIYVVWFQQQGSVPENEGALKVDKHQKGEFQTTTPDRNFEILVTAENDRSTKTPSDRIAMRGRVFVE